MGNVPLNPLHLEQVFVQSGVPTHTFVYPVEYRRLCIALRTPGRGIVVEGPSGIGKTTAVTKAITEVGLDARVLYLSARKADDVAVIEDLPHQLPFGTVVVDDFHRLQPKTKQIIADMLKTLADEGTPDSKLVVLGINKASQSLISFGGDLANRVEVIPFEVNPEHKVAELVAKGETALNVKLNVKDEIIQAAQGSFYLAQMLAYHTCLDAGITSWDDTPMETAVSFELVKGKVMDILARSFHGPAVAFARGSKLRPEGRAPYLHILSWLSRSDEWSINVTREADHYPNLRGSVTQVATKFYLAQHIATAKGVEDVLHYDSNNHILTVQDPQFVFYIRNLSWPKFAEEVGYVSLEFKARYDFAMSFAGPERSIAEAISDALREQEFEVFYDRYEQHRMLAEDLEDYLRPIYNSDASLVVCIMGPEYPKRVWTRFESEQFRERFKNGEVVPILLSTATLSMFDMSAKVGRIDWHAEQELAFQVQKAVELLTGKLTEIRERVAARRKPDVFASPAPTPNDQASPGGAVSDS